jgi:hypothetical protein
MLQVSDNKFYEDINSRATSKDVVIIPTACHYNDIDPDTKPEKYKELPLSTIWLMEELLQDLTPKKVMRMVSTFGIMTPGYGCEKHLFPISRMFKSMESVPTAAKNIPEVVMVSVVISLAGNLSNNKFISNNNSGDIYKVITNTVNLALSIAEKHKDSIIYIAPLFPDISLNPPKNVSSWGVPDTYTANMLGWAAKFGNWNKINLVVYSK